MFALLLNCATPLSLLSLSLSLSLVAAICPRRAGEEESKKERVSSPHSPHVLVFVRRGSDGFQKQRRVARETSASALFGVPPHCRSVLCFVLQSSVAHASFILHTSFSFLHLFLRSSFSVSLVSRLRSGPVRSGPVRSGPVRLLFLFLFFSFYFYFLCKTWVVAFVLDSVTFVLLYYLFSSSCQIISPLLP